jgi:predicted metal-dependent hydrolase
MVVNYQNGKIYKITSPHTDKVYIGSTAYRNLSRRFNEHKRDAKFPKKGRSVRSKIIIHAGDPVIELIMNYPCTSKEELTAKEEEIIDQYPNAVNRRYAKTNEEKENLRKLRVQRYLNTEKGKAKRAEYARNYYQNVLKKKNLDK